MVFGRKKQQQTESTEEEPFVQPGARARIAVAGAGPVGLSTAVLLAQNSDVALVETVPDKVAMVNGWVSPVPDADIEAAFAAAASGEHPLALRATFDPAAAYVAADIVVIATPTEYDAELGRFDASSVEAVVATVRAMNRRCWIVIASTVPVGYTAELRRRANDARIVCSPSFLRQGHALADTLHPARIVVGVDPTDARNHEFGVFFAGLVAEGAAEPMETVTRFICGSTEAEAIKMFSDAYLALRVSFFNELDSYAVLRGLDAGAIIEGACLDPRIGGHCNNPSFGYGGYRSPADAEQLYVSYVDVPQDLLDAIAGANDTRRRILADQICAILRDRVGFGTGVHPVVGVYRLVRKTDGGGLDRSATVELMRELKARNVDLIAYEPTYSGREFEGVELVPTIDELKRRSELILTNRRHAELEDVSEKVYTRDLFGRD